MKRLRRWFSGLFQSKQWTGERSRARVTASRHNPGPDAERARTMTQTRNTINRGL